MNFNNLDCNEKVMLWIKSNIPTLRIYILNVIFGLRRRLKQPFPGYWRLYTPKLAFQHCRNWKIHFLFYFSLEFLQVSLFKKEKRLKQYASPIQKKKSMRYDSDMLTIMLKSLLIRNSIFDKKETNGEYLTKIKYMKSKEFEYI